MLEISGWLAAVNAGPMARGRSAAPLSHEADAAALDAIEAAYRADGLPPAFRIAEVPGLQPVRAALAARGYQPAHPTLVKTGEASRLAALHDQPCDLLPAPDEAWGSVFMGEGFDPEEGAGRVAALSRASDAVYGAVRQDGRTVAVGVAAFGHGWAGVHGMRTARDCRGKGHASRILATLGREMAARGVENVFLQVEESNPARSLYRRAGFSAAWTYRYWTRP